MTFKTLRNFIDLGSDLVALVVRRMWCRTVRGGQNEISNFMETKDSGLLLGRFGDISGVLTRR